MISLGVEVSLPVPLPSISPLHHMAKGGGDAQQHMAQALQQRGSPTEELPGGQSGDQRVKGSCKEVGVGCFGVGG
jgi:hypothetical protein